MTGGHATLTKTNPYHLAFVLEKLEETGCEIDIRADEITLQGPEKLKPVDITTAVYPGFPTDMQAQWIALMTCADGTSNVTDTIYKDRFTHVPELARLGCDIQTHENTATVRGGRPLTGAMVMSTDLRASAAMVLAGLVAEGETEVLRVYHLDRGYDSLEKKLAALGADITREKTEAL
jgi:UDP-N-acetylglucosamine 1-carboxyvinyltransferase